MLNGWNAKHTLVTVAMLLVFALVLVFVLQRGGDDDSPEATPTPTPSETTTEAPSTPTPVASQPPAQSPLVVAPGRVGAAKAGMTKSQAAATGLFNTNVNHGPDDCRGVTPLEWKSSVSKSLDVYLNPSNEIATMGVTQGGPKTAEGIGVGTAFSQVAAAYPTLSPVVSAGFDQSGAFLTSGDDWLGFLFDPKPESIKGASKVVFMEVTHGAKPDLIRDGC